MITDSTQAIADNFAKNISLLKTHQPDIVDDLLAKFTEEPSIHPLEIIPSRKGPPVIKYRNALLHSQYDPQTEAKRFVAGLSIDQHINIALLGIGMGYHLRELIKQSAKRDFIVVIEQNIHIFKAFLQTVKLEDFYIHCNVYFVVNKTPMDIFRGLQGCALTILANGLTVIKHQASVKLNKPYYDATAEKIRDIFEWSRVNTISQINSSKQYADNIFANMSQYITTPGIKRLSNKFIDHPGIIISAGPSLIKNIRYLRQAKGKALLIAVDTALRVLLKHNIEPDLVISIDFTAHNARYFAGITHSDSALLVDPEVYPRIISDYNGPKFIISLPGKSLCDWLSSNIESKGDMDKGLSVAHTAFLVAKYLGLSPIGLLGQDLSFPGKMSHVRGSAMVRKNRVSKNDKDTTIVKNIFGGTDYTTAPMHVFLKHFEELMDKYSGTCYDLTEGGAFIQGTRPIPLKEFILTKTNATIDTKKIIHAAYKNPVLFNKYTLLESIHITLDSLEKVKRLSSDGEKTLQKLENKCITKKYSKSFNRLLEQWAFISHELNKQHDIFKLLGNNITDIMLLQAKKSSFDIESLDRSNTEGVLELISKDKAIFKRIAEQCHIFYQKFSIFQKTIKGNNG